MVQRTATRGQTHQEEEPCRGRRLFGPMLGNSCQETTLYELMGRCYSFECPKCGFMARVSGGEDRGANCFTCTIHCLDCRELFDVVTHLRQGRAVMLGQPKGVPLWDQHRKPAFSPPPHAGHSGVLRHAARRLSGKVLPGGGRAKWAEFKVECPQGKHHRIKVWADPGHCPRCGSYLDKNVVPYRLWE